MVELSHIKGKYDLIIKFGMNLLTIPDDIDVKFGVISFHHGDPEKYRGRPAGFYEVMNNEDCVGIIVQRLSNNLDGGEIYAKAYSKIWDYSYKKTSANFYKNSIPLLRKSILNFLNGKSQANEARGKIFTLPSNLVTLLFIGTLFRRKLIKLIYGIFYEKKWNVFIGRTNGKPPIEYLADAVSIKIGLVPKIQRRYTFYADPFFSAKGDQVYVEALNKYNGQGEILNLNIQTGSAEKSILSGNHYSYPQSIINEGCEYIFPEISNLTSQHFIKLLADGSQEYEVVKGLENYRLVDATYTLCEGKHYIFASKSEESADKLLLFYSGERLGPYAEHPMNPIVIDPTCARMAGSLLFEDGRIYRFGQNNAFGYGDKLWMVEITHLSPYNYSEKKIQEIKFKERVCGPHTINFNSELVAMDFYENKFSLLAGYRRFLNMVMKK